MSLAAFLGIASAFFCWRWGRPSRRLHGLLCATVAVLWLVILLLLAVAGPLEIQIPAPVQVRTLAPPAAV